MTWFTPYITFSDGSVLSAADLNGTVSAINNGTMSPAHGGVGITTYTAGDLVYATAATALAKLAIGSSSQVLTVSGGLPVWADATSASVAVKVTSFTKNMADASGSQVVSGLGHTPRLVWVFAANADESSRFSVGASDGTTHGCIFGQRNSGTGFTAANTSNAIFIQSSTPADTYRGTIGSLASGQFTITWTKGGSMSGTMTGIVVSIG